jgi:Septum formation
MRISTTRVVAVAAAFTVTALGVTGPSYAGPQRAGGMTGAPTVGACSTMTPQQGDAMSDHSTVVDCSQGHTAQVAGVVKLPKQLDWNQASTNDLFRVVADRCLPEVAAALGRDAKTRDTSAYHYLYFAPTKAQRNQGARWLSCSIIRPKDSELAKLPTSSTPFLPGGRLPDSLARCLSKAVRNTPCSAAHAWRATGTFWVAGTYPGQKALNKKALGKCRSRVKSDKPYRWTYRDKITWNVAHDHVVVCYSKTGR